MVSRWRNPRATSAYLDANLVVARHRERGADLTHRLQLVGRAPFVQPETPHRVSRTGARMRRMGAGVLRGQSPMELFFLTLECVLLQENCANSAGKV